MSLSAYDSGGPSSVAPDRAPGRFALRIGIIHGNRLMADLLRYHAEVMWAVK